MSLDGNDLRSAWEELDIGRSLVASARLSKDEAAMRAAEAVSSPSSIDTILSCLAEAIERDGWSGFDFDVRAELFSTLSGDRSLAWPLVRALRSYSTEVCETVLGHLRSDGSLDIEQQDVRALAASAAEDVRSALAANALVRWFESKDRAIMRFATGWPACWGGQYRVSDLGHYVPEERALEILPTAKDMDLYLCMCEPDGIEDVVEIARHANDPGWLEDRARDYVERADAVVFYTETAEPDEEYSFEELVELAGERPDLFTAGCIDEHPCLEKPAAAARARAAAAEPPKSAARAAAEAASKTAGRSEAPSRRRM